MSNRKLTKLEDMPMLASAEKIMFCEEKDYTFQANGFNLNSSSFIRLRIKEAMFDGGSITNSIFEDIYAKKASFSNVDFSGTVFKDCNFDKATFYNCNFRYCSFSNCLLPINEIIACLPTESNLRKELANNLKVNFSSLGKRKIADVFLDIEIKAEQKEQFEIFRSKTSYYKSRFDIGDRLIALMKYAKSKLLGFVWGYGHRLSQLFKSYLIIMLIFSLIVYFTKSKFFIQNIGSIRELNLQESIFIIYCESINFNHISIIPYETFSIAILFIIRFLGILYIGLLVASLFRKINR